MLAIITSHPIQYQAPLWREMARAGIDFEVWFLTPHAIEDSFDPGFGRAFAWDLNLLEGYRHRFLPIGPDWSLDSFFGIRVLASWRDEFKARGVKRVWVEGWRFLEFWKAVISAHAEGLEVWMRGETNDLARGSLLRAAWRRPLLRRLFRDVDRFLCIGSANRRFYSNLGIASDRLFSAPYCVDNARFAESARQLFSRGDAPGDRWNIMREAYVVLFCGKLIRKKSPLIIAEAARLAPVLAGRPVHLLFAGDGELAPALRASLALKGTPPGTITGFLNQTEIPRAFAAADCLVLPSDYGETWGLVANEALASSVPIIVSDRCGCAEDLAAPLGRAHVFPFGDVRALADSMTWVARNPPPADLIGRIAEMHSPERTVEAVQRILSEGPVQRKDEASLIESPP